MKKRKIMASVLLATTIISSPLMINSTRVYAATNYNLTDSGVPNIPILQSKYGKNIDFYRNGFPEKIYIENDVVYGKYITLKYSLNNPTYSNFINFLEATRPIGYVYHNKKTSTYTFGKFDQNNYRECFLNLNRGENIVPFEDPSSVRLVYSVDSPVIQSSDVHIKRTRFFNWIYSSTMTPNQQLRPKRDYSYGFTEEKAYSLANTLGISIEKDLTGSFAKAGGTLSLGLKKTLQKSITETLSYTNSISQQVTVGVTHVFESSNKNRRVALYQYNETYTPEVYLNPFINSKQWTENKILLNGKGEPSTREFNLIQPIDIEEPVENK